MGMAHDAKRQTSSKATTSKRKPLKPSKPLLSVSKPPAFSFAPSSTKGKGKAAQKKVVDLTDDSEDKNGPAAPEDDRLWVDRYEPQVEAELAVHKRKVEDVRRWFQEALDGGPNGNLRKYGRVLVLTGPSGAAKTTTVRILAREVGCQISEWSNSIEETSLGDGYEHEGLIQKFGTFLSRAAACTPLLNMTSSSLAQTTPSGSASSSKHRFRRDVVLLEDLPNVLHQPTQEAFHAALESFVASPMNTPLVIVISDASTRAETRDERLQAGGGGWASRDTVDIRSVLPPSLINSPFITQIAFNPIAPTLMQRALQELVTKYCDAAGVPQSERPTKADIELIVETSNGDIRSAIMALQFSCVRQPARSQPLGQTKKGKKKSSLSARGLMEAVTRREQALHLFHLLGKVLYNKRKGDPPGSSATLKDKAREAELDAQLKEPSELPFWLSEHKRRPSRLSADSLYADSPIDTGLFGLYIHQNYTQFCDDLDQTGDLCDWLSWIDSSGGEHWYQSNPYQFHLLTLGTIHSLPSPVPRRNQKMYKPEFFDVMKKTREAEDSLTDVWVWFQNLESARHSRTEIALEMGNVLKLRLRPGSGKANANKGDLPPPHSAFSSLAFSYSDSMAAAGATTLDEKENLDDVDDVGIGVPGNGERPARRNDVGEAEDNEGAYLSSDDIEDF